MGEYSALSLGENTIVWSTLKGRKACVKGSLSIRKLLLSRLAVYYVENKGFQHSRHTGLEGKNPAEKFISLYVNMSLFTSVIKVYV